jgi:indole-3-glycerol phosphate synthase
MVDPWQVYQSATLGADVILLIVAALELPVLKELHAAANETNLETLIEVHTLPELEIALQFPKAIIGVNNRDLATLKTDISTAVKLAGSIPKNRIAIAESGINNRSEVEKLMKLGYRGFLVGTSLLKAASPGTALAKLVGKP